jgi:aspartate carbamoyltransferase catalytic subunit
MVMLTFTEKNKNIHKVIMIEKIKSKFRWPYNDDMDILYQVMMQRIEFKKVTIEMTQTEYDAFDRVLPETDVLYVTRVQRERFSDDKDYEKVAGAYVIDPEVMKAAKERMIVMHPLPRVTEISIDFDDDPRAAYFRQMEYGLYVRMALLAMVLGKA